MAKRRMPAMSDAEAEVINLLWDRGPGTVRELHDMLSNAGQHWTRSTVITLLQRLERKGYVASDKSRFAFVFRPAVTREDVMRERIAELADELCAGQAAPLVMAFAERHRFTTAEIERFRKMIDEMESKRKRRAN